MSETPGPNFIPSDEDIRRDIDPRTGLSFYKMLPADYGGESYYMECKLCKEQGNIMSQEPLIHRKDCPLSPEFRRNYASIEASSKATVEKARPHPLSYFSRPFPSRRGFSAYRSPGLIVHVPVWAMLTFLGMALCLPHGYLGWAILLWSLAGLYFGRDLAIYCHYIPLLTLVLLSGCVFAWANADRVFKWGEHHSPLLAMTLTFSLGAFLVWSCLRFAKEDY